MNDSPHSMRDRILAHRERLEQFLRQHARGLERYDRPSDVLQDVCARALQEEGNYEHRSDGEFMAWLLQVARRHVADRNRHLHRLKRDAGPLLRLTLTGSGDESGGVEALADGVGPSTFAERRELVQRAMRALETLPERDRALVRAMNGGKTVSEIATEFGLETGAAQRARLRALDRFRRAFRALAGR